MGKWLDRILPPETPAPGSALAAYSPLRRTTNPPTTQPTSPLTHAISVVSAVDGLRDTVVNRARLLAIPAFRKAVMLVTGTAGTLPYQAFNSADVRTEHKLLSQPERGIGRVASVSMTQLAEDLYLYGASLWYVTDTDKTTGFPTSVRRVPFEQWDQDEDTGQIIIAGQKQPPEKVRLFESPFDGLLSVAGPTVFLIQALTGLTLKYASSPQAREYLRGTDGLDLADEEIQDLLADWMEKRKQGVTAYLPPDLELGEVSQMTPEQMTLIPAQMFAVDLVSNLTGIDGFWLGGGKNSGFTYSNRVDIRQDLLDLHVLPGLVRPIELRLSADDITPHGQYVRANTDYFLRANTLERMQAYQIGSQVGAYDPKRISELEQIGRVIRPPKPASSPQSTSTPEAPTNG